MAGLASAESERLIAKAIVELLEGKPGEGIAHVRNLAALPPIVDPVLADPKYPKAPNPHAAITNRVLDGWDDEPTYEEGPVLPETWRGYMAKWGLMGLGEKKDE